MNTSTGDFFFLLFPLPVWCWSKENGAESNQSLPKSDLRAKLGAKESACCVSGEGTEVKNNFWDGVWGESLRSPLTGAGGEPCPASLHNNPLLPEGSLTHSPAVRGGLEVGAARLHHRAHSFFILPLLHHLFLPFNFSFFPSLHSCVVLPPSSRLLPLHTPPTFLALRSYIRRRDQRTDDLSFRIFLTVPPPLLPSSFPSPSLSRLSTGYGPSGGSAAFFFFVSMCVLM